MNPIDIILKQETVILRARGSEILILSQHVRALRTMKEPSDFVEYFKSAALINRPARKLFEAWLRKDPKVWQRLYKVVRESSGNDLPDAASSGDEHAPSLKKNATGREDAEEAHLAEAAAMPAGKLQSNMKEDVAGAKTKKPSKVSKAAKAKPASKPASKKAPKTVAKKTVAKKSSPRAAKGKS